MARVVTTKKKMRLLQELKGSLEQQAPTLRAYAKTRSEISDVCQEEPAAQKVPVGSKHVTAHLRKSL